MCVTRFILLPFGVIVQMSPRKSLLPTGTMHVKAMHFPLGDQVGAKDWTAPIVAAADRRVWRTGL
jgi:hypothetical protein